MPQSRVNDIVATHAVVEILLIDRVGGFIASGSDSGLRLFSLCSLTLLGSMPFMACEITAYLMGIWPPL